MRSNEDSLEGKVDEFLFSVCNEEGERLDDLKFEIFIVEDNLALLNPNYPIALLHNKILLVDKSEECLITSDDLHFIDVDNSGMKFLYLLRTTPKSGKLLLDGNELRRNATFSQEMINLGKLSYQNEKKISDWDQFIFSLIDKKGENIASNTCIIRVVEGNTAPKFVHKSSLTLEKGEKVPIVNNILSVRDKEQSAVELKYILFEIPSNGCLFHVEKGILEQNAHFTQRDIDQEKIIYQHFGKNAETDSFGFSVKDGAGGSTKKMFLRLHIHDEKKEKRKDAFPDLISRESVDSNSFEEYDENLLEEFEEILDLFKSTTFPVNKGSIATITSSDLQVFEILSKKSSLILTITELPKYGELLLDGLPLPVNTALVKDVFDRGRVSYCHKSSCSEEDAFCFDVQDSMNSSRQRKKMKISIMEEYSSPFLVERHTLFVCKGSALNITNRLLRALDLKHSEKEIVYTMIKSPDQGMLIHSEFGLLDNIDIFTQEDIDKGFIFYSHEADRLGDDIMVFSISNGSGGRIENVTVNVCVTEKLFSLVCKNAPFVKRGKEIALSENNLKVVHTSSKKSNIRFSLEKQAKEGELLFKSVPIEEGKIFSQNDINKGFISYRHRG